MSDAAGRSAFGSAVLGCHQIMCKFGPVKKKISQPTKNQSTLGHEQGYLRVCLSCMSNEKPVVINVGKSKEEVSPEA